MGDGQVICSMCDNRTCNRGDGRLCQGARSATYYDAKGNYIGAGSTDTFTRPRWLVKVKGWLGLP